MMSTSFFRRRSLAALLVGAALGLSGCASGDEAPASSFVLLDGSTTTTADLKGKVTLVNFWATTCVTCVKEMPSLVSCRIAGMPCGVAGTLTIRLSRDTALCRRRASASVSSVSRAR